MTRMLLINRTLHKVRLLFQITGLDVTCEKSGMTVNLQFSAPFNGVVFSKGHFSNPACR